MHSPFKLGPLTSFDSQTVVCRKGSFDPSRTVDSFLWRFDDNVARRHSHIAGSHDGHYHPGHHQPQQTYPADDSSRLQVVRYEP